MFSNLFYHGIYLVLVIQFCVIFGCPKVACNLLHHEKNKRLNDLKSHKVKKKFSTRSFYLKKHVIMNEDPLSLSPLMIWYSGLTALFFFFLARAASAFLPTAFYVAPRPLFPFLQTQYVQVFPLKPAPFCTLFTDVGSTNKSAISLLLSDSRSVFATLSSPPSFLSSQTLWQIWQELSSLSCSIRLQWAPGHSFLPGNDAADELDRRGALLAPSAIPCSLSPRGVLSHLNSLTHRFPQFPRRNLCSLCSLSSTLQWTQPSFRFVSL